MKKRENCECLSDHTTEGPFGAKAVKTIRRDKDLVLTRYPFICEITLPSGVTRTS